MRPRPLAGRGWGAGGLCNPFRVHPSPNRAGRGAASMVPSFQNWEIASVARRSTAACDRQKRRACGVTGGLIKRAEAIATLCVWSEPAICTEADCDHVAEIEPDQDAGYCEVCGKNTVVAALVLAGLI